MRFMTLVFAIMYIPFPNLFLNLVSANQTQWSTISACPSHNLYMLFLFNKGSVKRTNSLNICFLIVVYVLLYIAHGLFF